MKRKVLIALASMVVIVLAANLLKPNRPGTLSMAFSSHVVAPAIKRLTENGHVITYAWIRASNETGSARYLNGWSDELQYKLAWYDILDDQAYAIDFSVRAREISTLDLSQDHASIRIITGPGADVAVITTHPEIARRIANKLEFASLSYEDYPPKVLRNLCARPLAADDPLAMEFMTIYHEVAAGRRGNQHHKLERSIQARERHISRNDLPISRCLTEGTDT